MSLCNLFHGKDNVSGLPTSAFETCFAEEAPRMYVARNAAAAGLNLIDA